MCPIITAKDLKLFLCQHVSRKNAEDANYIRRKVGNKEDLGHMIWMMMQVESGEISGEKAHRWIGFVQGVAHATGLGNVKDFRKMNKKT